MGFWWYKFEKWGEKNLEYTFQNRHFRPPKIRGFGLRRTEKKFADSESVTTLHKSGLGVLPVAEDAPISWGPWCIVTVNLSFRALYSVQKICLLTLLVRKHFDTNCKVCMFIRHQRRSSLLYVTKVRPGQLGLNTTTVRRNFAREDLHVAVSYWKTASASTQSRTARGTDTW